MCLLYYYYIVVTQYTIAQIYYGENEKTDVKYKIITFNIFIFQDVDKRVSTSTFFFKLLSSYIFTYLMNVFCISFKSNNNKCYLSSYCLHDIL